MQQDIISKTDTALARSEVIVFAEFVSQCDCPQELIAELIEIGWVSPAQSTSQGELYRSADVYKVRKLCRICTDFELPTIGGAIIVDLLKRINELERRFTEIAK